MWYRLFVSVASIPLGMIIGVILGALLSGTVSLNFAITGGLILAAIGGLFPKFMAYIIYLFTLSLH